MDALKIILALHAPGVRPDLLTELRARGHRVVATHNQAETWNAVRARRPDAVLLVPGTHQSDAPELTSLVALAADRPGPALLVVTDRPALLEAHAEHVADFLASDAPLDEILRRMRFGIRRQRAMATVSRERDEALQETTTDFKTGLANDRGFHEACRIECSRAAREGRPLGVLMIDLDEFKSINDLHDHDFGDHVLRRIGEILLHGLRPFDTPARKGGDEFAVLLPNTPLDHVKTIAERLRAAVAAAPMVQGEHRAQASITVGAGAWSPADDESFEEVLRGADQALLAAKRKGRNRVGVYAGPLPDDLELEDEPDGAGAATGSADPDPDPDPEPEAEPEAEPETETEAETAGGDTGSQQPRKPPRRTRKTRSTK